jgi:hypothetical protein
MGKLVIDLGERMKIFADPFLRVQNTVGAA